MKAKITLPSGTVIEVDASEAEIRRLAGELGYRLQMLPTTPPAICICGHAFSSIFPPVCPVHGAPFRFNWRPTCAAAANPTGQVWRQALVGVYA